MKKQKERIPKPLMRVVEDFFDHAANLKESLKLYHAGERRAVKSLLHCLRVLITKESLLIKVNEKLDLGVGVLMTEINGGSQGTPPKEVKVAISLEEYQNRMAMVMHGKEFSNSEFVWELASQSSVHEDDGLDPAFVAGESFIINGQTSINATLGCIARTIDSVCDLAVKNINIRIEQARCGNG